MGKRILHHVTYTKTLLFVNLCVTLFYLQTLDDIDVTSFQNDSREEEQIQDLHQGIFWVNYTLVLRQRNLIKLYYVLLKN